ncbi:hypothetical protein ACL2XP_08485 [Sodalis sp. RH21]|uniref:hypothetical protein n=1 Tax=unclassified Sodalis (in: enterobacteria) TaxID=2636512 RepID=UPI0039B3BC84
MNDEIAARLALINLYTPADAALLLPLLGDCAQRAAGVAAYGARHFPPALLPATAWVSPLHPPAAMAAEED